MCARTIVKVFELGPGRKFRASTGQNGFLRLEIRTPLQWQVVTAPDLIEVATNALALAGAGEPPPGFKFTTDDRYVGVLGPHSHLNPFLCRRTGA